MKKVISITLIFSFSAQVFGAQPQAPAFSCELYNPSIKYDARPDVKKTLDNQIKSRAMRLKLEGIYDIALSATQKWMNVPGFLPNRDIYDYYVSSKAAAEYTLSNTSKEVLQKQKEDLIVTRLQVFLNTHNDFDELAELRRQISTSEVTNFPRAAFEFLKGNGWNNKFDKISEEISKLEKKLNDQEIFLNYPDLFEPKSAMAMDFDILRLNNAAGAFVPNDLYRNISTWFYKNYSTSEPTEEVPIPVAILHVAEFQDEGKLREAVRKNRSELLDMFNRKSAQMFFRSHLELYQIGEDESKNFYFNNGLVTLAADELIKAGKVSEEQLIQAYGAICEARLKMAENNKIKEKGLHYLSVANTALGFISLLFIGATVGSRILGGLIRMGEVTWSARIAEVGARIRIHGKQINEVFGAVFAGTLLAEGQVGFVISDYDREIKNLFLLKQMAMKSDATEADKIKAEIADGLLKAAATQAKASESVSKGVNGFFFVGVSMLSIPVILKELKDVESLVKMRVLIGQFGRGKVAAPEFLEEVYKIRTGKLAKEINAEDFQQWLTALRLDKVVAPVTASKKSSIVIRITQRLESSPAPKNIKAINEGLMETLGKFESTEALEAAEALLINAKKSPQRLEQVRRALASASESPVKQNYLATAGGRLSVADRAVLNTWEDATAIQLVTRLKTKAQAFAKEDKALFHRDQRAWEKALQDGLGKKGYHKLCIEEGCPLCFVN